MQASPLQLEGYFLKELQFSLADGLTAIPSASAKYDAIGIKVDTDTTLRDGDPLKWRCELTVESGGESDKKTPYTFRITFVGFFRVSKGYPAERVEIMARTNAPAVLYSAAREALVPLTSRGPYAAIVLPSVTFLEPTPPPTQTEGLSEKRLTKRIPGKKSTRKPAKK